MKARIGIWRILSFFSVVLFLTALYFASNFEKVLHQSANAVRVELRGESKITRASLWGESLRGTWILLATSSQAEAPSRKVDLVCTEKLVRRLAVQIEPSASCEVEVGLGTASGGAVIRLSEGDFRSNRGPEGRFELPSNLGEPSPLFGRADRWATWPGTAVALGRMIGACGAFLLLGLLVFSALLVSFSECREGGRMSLVALTLSFGVLSPALLEIERPFVKWVKGGGIEESEFTTEVMVARSLLRKRSVSDFQVLGSFSGEPYYGGFFVTAASFPLKNDSKSTNLLFFERDAESLGAKVLEASNGVAYGVRLASR